MLNRAKCKEQEKNNEILRREQLEYYQNWGAYKFPDIYEPIKPVAVVNEAGRKKKINSFSEWEPVVIPTRTDRQPELRLINKRRFKNVTYPDAVSAVRRR